MNKKLILVVCLAVLVIALIAAGILKNNGVISSESVFTVDAAPVERGAIASYISANGTVAPIERSMQFMDTPVKVTKLYVNKNDKVKKGDKIMELDFTDLNLQLEQVKLQKATQELALKKLKLTDPTINLDSYENALKAAQNSVALAQKNYDTAMKSYTDSKVLYTADGASESILTQSEEMLADAESALNNAKLNLETQKAAVNSAEKSNNQLLNNKQIDIQTQEIAIQISELNIKDLETRLEKYTAAMVSATDGIISQLNVTEGAYTQAAQPVYEVINPDKLEVRLNINEYNAKKMKPGLTVNLSGDSIPDKEKITGKVKSVSPVAARNVTNAGSTETVIEVTVSIDTITQSLKPGITVNCDIETVKTEDVLTISLDMLSQDKDGNTAVYVLSEDKKTMHKKPVTIGNTSDMRAELVSGDLGEGELVVMNPQPSFTDGARVRLHQDK